MEKASKKKSRSVKPAGKKKSRSVKRPRKVGSPAVKIASSGVSRSVEKATQVDQGGYLPIWSLSSRSITDEDQEDYSSK